METNIILDGFKKAEQTHGLRYTRFIGDGDSSVCPTPLMEVPIWGRDIIKMECANHACKIQNASTSLNTKEDNHRTNKNEGNIMSARMHAYLPLTPTSPPPSANTNNSNGNENTPDAAVIEEIDTEDEQRENEIIDSIYNQFIAHTVNVNRSHETDATHEI